jgi:hypothetical protein
MVHDFNPGIGASGLWWLLQVPDDAVTITEDTVHISLKDAFVVDQFSFPGGAGDNLGAAGPPAKVSFDVTYTKTGTPRRIHPTSVDPISPFDWAGEMWMATNSGTFSVAYNDGSFSASGSFDSAGNFGEVGFERNGVFVREDEEEKAKLDPAAMPLVNNLAASPASKTTATGQLVTNVPKLRGQVPLSELIHRH